MLITKLILSLIFLFNFVNGGVVITSGDEGIVVGIGEYGELNTPYNGAIAGALGWSTTDPAIGSPNYVGLRSRDGVYAATEPGCQCEGFGVSFYYSDGSHISTFANVDVGTDPGIHQISQTGSHGGASSITIAQDGSNTIQVTHDFHLSSSIYAIEGTITLRNLGSTPVENAYYRRVMDWDIPPTHFNEFVSIIGTEHTTMLERSHDQGFCSGDPATFCSPINLATEYCASFARQCTDESRRGVPNDFVDNGPRDHGALFDFRLGALAPAGSDGDFVEFTIYYGLTPSIEGKTAEENAIDTLHDLGVEVYSLGQQAVGADVGEPYTFFFAFSGVGGVVVPPASDECLASDLFLFDWEILTEHGDDHPTEGRQIPRHEVLLFDVDKPSLTLNIVVKVEFVTLSSADDQDMHNFPVSYVLDFEDYTAHSDPIHLPGTCEQRNGDDYLGFTDLFAESWQKSYFLEDIGTTNNMLFPPTDGTKWTIIESNCEWVTYSGSFEWEDLRSCNNYDSSLEPYTTVTDTGATLDLEGVFYINVVSPFWWDREFNYYRVYQILSQPFIISVNKRVDVLSGAGINVITVSIIAVYKEGDQRGDSDPNTKIGENIFRLIVLTEAAEYMYLSNMVLNSFTGATPAASLILLGDDLNAVPTAVTTSEGCLDNKFFLCSQLWEINAADIRCDESSDRGTDFSGNYVLTFNTNCVDTDPLLHCMTWLGAHPSISPTVTVSADLTWVDNVCNTEVFTVEFPGSMEFYTDNTFLSLAGSDHLFEVGVDFIFVQVTITYPPDTFDVFDAVLRDVWICTTAPSDLTDPLGEVSELRDDPTALVGCLSDSRDAMFDDDFYHIYDGTDSYHDFAELADPVLDGTAILRFKFKVPHSVERDTLWVHTRIEVELSELPRRRRMLLSGTGNTNQIGMNIEQTGVTRDPNYIKPKQPEKEPYPQKPIQPQPQIPTSPNNTFYLSLSSPWVMAIGGLLGLILTFNIIMMCYMNCNKQQRGRASFSSNKRNGYNKVKRADSEFDESEANAINVVSE